MSSSDPRLESAQSRFKDADIDPDDRDIIESVTSEMRRQNHSESHLRKHLESLTRVALDRHSDDSHGVPLRTLVEDEDGVDRLREYVNMLTREDTGEPLSEWTKYNIRQALRKAGAILDGAEEDDAVPFPASKITGTFQGDPEDTAPKPGEVFYWGEHMVPLLEDGATNPRDAAYLATGWDGACRPWELRDLTYGDITERGEWLQITIGGKDTPDRDNILFVATPYLKYWLKVEHPANETKRGFSARTPVWTQIENNVKLGDSAFPNIFPRAVKRAGLDDMPTATKMLRKSRASVLATRVVDDDTQYDQGDLENHMGWESGSSVAPIYISRFGDISNIKRGRDDGAPEEHLPDYGDQAIEDPAPVKCPHCDFFTPRHADTCISCNREFALTDATDVDLDVERDTITKKRLEYLKKRDAFMRDVIQDRADPDKLDIGIRHGGYLDGQDDAEDVVTDLRGALGLDE